MGLSELDIKATRQGFTTVATLVVRAVTSHVLDRKPLETQ